MTQFLLVLVNTEPSLNCRDTGQHRSSLEGKQPRRFSRPQPEPGGHHGDSYYYLISLLFWSSQQVTPYRVWSSTGTWVTWSAPPAPGREKDCRTPWPHLGQYEERHIQNATLLKWFEFPGTWTGTSSSSSSSTSSCGWGSWSSSTSRRRSGREWSSGSGRVKRHQGSHQPR